MQPETQTRREEEEEEEEKEDGGVCVCARGGVNARAYWFEDDNVKACP